MNIIKLERNLLGGYYGRQITHHYVGVCVQKAEECKVSLNKMGFLLQTHGLNKEY